MDPESKKLLENAIRLNEENNEMLKEIRRHMRVSRFITIMYWVFIIGSTVGAFYLIQPYIDQIKNIYGGAADILNNFQQ